MFAIIVAGGRGVRMGYDVPKQFLPLGDKPVLMHTLERFHQFDKRLKLILVLPANQYAYWRVLCNKHGFNIPHQLREGGETRFESVKNGLDLVEDGLVAIHDGVRPFVSIETIARCFKAAQTCDTAVPVVYLEESLRRITPQGSEAQCRDDFRVVQTPQVFKAHLLRSSYELPWQPSFTDDASVVEAAGHEITLVEGNRENIKITSPLDLVIGNALLKQGVD